MITGMDNPVQQILEQEQARLTSEIDGLAPHEVIRENLGYGNHMADDATEAFEQAKVLALRRNLEDMLAEVNDALDRLERGTYGICESCAKPIDPERLKVLPYARLCMDCQQKRK